MNALLLTLLLQQPAPAERKWEQMDYGPFFSSCVTMASPKGAITPKGIVVKVGNGSVCFDTDLLRYAAAWTDGWLTLMGPAYDGIRNIDEKTRPAVQGIHRFGARGPGWAKAGRFEDPRLEPYGPLPADWAKWKGLYVHGDRVVFSYTVGACPVMEMPGFLSRQGVWAFSRTFRLGPSAEPLTLVVCEGEGGVGAVNGDAFTDRRGPVNRVVAVAGDVLAGVGSPAGGGNPPLPEGSEWRVDKGRVLLCLPPLSTPALFQILIGSGREGDRPVLHSMLRESPEDPALFTKGGPARYPESVETKGAPGRAGGPYEVDTLTAPDTNPWNSWLRFGGLDFFADGRAALCTWSGDVWVVSGIDEKLERLRWHRFATGLFQPCGLKIVDGKIYAVGRDQITRFHDLNGDGEADFYENFNNDCTEKGNYHEFAMDLNTDAEGNFYYSKGAQGANFKPGPSAAHHGTMLKVSKDGKKMEIFATGIRAAAGSGVGPRGEITASDNDGHWGPSSKLSLLRPGGYYGDPNTAHREPVPADYDPPLCWIPRGVDNSSGGQVWVTSDRWGPFTDRMLHLSYGTCSLFLVLRDGAQGGVVRFPLTFASGILRGRFHPKDGQLYVAGIKGWSTSGQRDGCFQRVRYTGKPVHGIRDLRVTSSGMDLTFVQPLDAEIAADPDSYLLQWWNYQYTEKYGSPEFSVADPKKRARDTIEIKSAKLSSDGKTVSLEIPSIQPVMQLSLRYKLRGADATRITEEIFYTIHTVPGR